MSDHGSSKGKATDHSEANNAVGFRPQANMTVEPPKPEDLQKSYASIVGNDANPKGWYGSMSREFSHWASLCQRLTLNKQSMALAPL